MTGGLGHCVRCMTPRKAATIERLSYGSSTYQLPLCDQHADKFQLDMFGWSRCGDVVEEFVSFAPKVEVQERNLGRLVVSHLHIPAQAPAPEPEAVEVPPRPQPRFDTSPLIKAERWSFSQHARDRMEQRGVSEDEALWCAEFPDVVRDGEDGRRVHSRGPIKVVVDPETNVIITVADRRKTDDHPTDLHKEFEHAS